MSSPIDPEKNIVETKGLITRTEERVQRLQARGKPGTARMVHALTNNIRGYRRDLHNLLARQRSLGNQNGQLRKQQAQMQQAQRDASPDRRKELPERQDQEPRKLAPNQSRGAGQ